MGVVNINGRIFSGNSISLKNGKVFIDGKAINTGNDKQINIEVTGNIDSLIVDYCNDVKVNGDVSKVKTMSGNVEVAGNVTGDIKSMSGDVKCGDVGGRIKTMSGNVRKN